MEELGDSLPNKSTRVMLLVTEDWFVLSHFQPLVRALVSACGEVVVVTTSSGRLKEIEALGARVIAMDFARASVESGRQMAIIRQLRRLIIDEAPAIVHAISLKPVGLAGLALRGLGRAGQRPRLVMHLTGTGPTGRTVPGQMPPAYIATIAVTRLLMRLPDTSLIVENPDDAARIAGPDWAGNRRVMIIGGAGIDPSSYITARRPEGGKVVVGYLGRMLWTKGVGHLVDAVRLLHQRRADLELLLGGTPDGANRWSIPQATLDEWATLPGVSLLGQVADVAAFWSRTDIAVIPSTWGEGLPRVLLEAAASARPLIVTDVPGCRYFVRHEREGLIVPPGDPDALAAAIARLMADAELARRLGDGARQRVLDGFTEAHIMQAVRSDYRRILQS